MRRIHLAATLYLLVRLAAQPAYYPFSIDQDQLAGAPDFSFLNHPLTAADKVSVRDGHFVTGSGEPIRFFGVNLAFSANFPSAEDSVRIARRLRRLGVNLVRLHHMDSQPDTVAANESSLLTTGPYPTLNAGSVTRLRTFLNALKEEGIYVNLNLKVGYVFRPGADGVPAGTIPTQSKPLHIFEPRMRALQGEFTRKTIEALQLEDDPVLAMVEVNNESSLLYSYQTNQLDDLIGGAYRSELERQWNVYLATRYESTTALRAAWGSSEPDGDQLLSDRWQLEVHSGASATLTEPSAGVVQINFTRNESEVIAKKTGFSTRFGDVYLAEMQIRADQPVAVYWDIKQDVSPWRTMASRSFTATPAWQTVSLTVNANFDMDRIGRFGVQLSRSVTPVQIRNARLIRRGMRGLSESESLENANIALPGSEGSNEARARDWVEFLAAADKIYLDEILAQVRASTSRRVPVTGTQMNFGGLMNIDTHAALDYLDSHFYVDHYNFPNVQWDGRDWRIRDSSHLIGGALSNLVNLAFARAAGKPYTIGEFNQAWPNTRGHELIPVLSAFAAFQDWDGLMHFAYSHGRNWDAGVPNGFNLNGDWSKWISFGQAAWLYRTGAVQSGTSSFLIPAGFDDRYRFTRERRNSSFAAFYSQQSISTDNVFRYRIALDPSAGSEIPSALTSRPESPILSESGEWTYDPASSRFLIHSAKAAGVTGAWSGRVTAGPLDLMPTGDGASFRSILLTSLDDMPLVESARMLLTNPGHTLRTSSSGIQPLIRYPGTTDWFTIQPDLATRPSGDLNGGMRPTWMARTDTEVLFRSQATRLAVYPLDGSGSRGEALPVEKTDNGFRFRLAASSPWYEIIAGDR
jgi:hypothetical protein